MKGVNVDTARFEMTYRKTQDHLVKQVINSWETSDEVSDGILCGVRDLDSGGYDEIVMLARLGVVFYGSHGIGYEFCEGVFACDGRELVYTKAIYGQPAIVITEDLELDPHFTREIQNYWKVYRLVENGFRNLLVSKQ